MTVSFCDADGVPVGPSRQVILNDRLTGFVANMSFSLRRAPRSVLFHMPGADAADIERAGIVGMRHGVDVAHHDRFTHFAAMIRRSEILDATTRRE